MVQRHRQHRRLIEWRTTHVAAVVNRILAQGHARDAHHREAALAVVVAGVVAKWTLDRAVAGMDESFQQDFGAGRCVEARQRAVPELATLAAQQAGKFVLAQGIGYRRNRCQQGGRIGTERHQDRERLVRSRCDVVGIIERAAAVRKPAHDQRVRADQLLAVDGDVLSGLTRAAGDHQAKGDQPCDVLRPAALNRQQPEIDILAVQHRVFECRGGQHAGCHMRELRQFRPALQGRAQRRRPARFLDRSQQFAQFLQRSQRASAECRLDTSCSAEQVAEQRNVRASRLLEQQRRTIRLKRAQAEGRAFQFGIDRLGDALELALVVQQAQELT